MLAHALGALDGKHIAMKKPKKLRSDYYNCKDFFYLVLLALVDTEYRFLWVDCGSSDSSLDVQIFSRGDLREKIKDGTLGLLAPGPLGNRGPELYYFFLGHNAFALMPWTVNPYSRRQLKREERKASYRIYRGRWVVENTFGILVSGLRVILGTSTLFLRVWCCTTC